MDVFADALPGFVWLETPGGHTVYANQRWREYTGLDDPQQWERLVHPEDAARLRVFHARALESGEPFEDECRYRGKDGKYRWFLLRCAPVRDAGGAIANWLRTATDIDKQKRAEAQQAFFALASDVLGSTLEVETTLERIARLAIASIGTWCQIDLPDAQGVLRPAVIAHQEPQKEDVLRRLIGARIYNDAAQAGPPAVYATQKPQLLNRVSEEAVRYVIPGEAHREVYRAAGYASGLMVPLRMYERVLGVLGIASDDPTRLYTDFDVAIASELARRGAIALHNAQSFAREHRVATLLQQALLPAALPENHRVRFWAAYAPAPSTRGDTVGGDWYDAFALDDDRIAISVGDVAGHGIEAAVTMGVARQAIRAAALHAGEPAAVLEQADRVMRLEPRKPMITAIFAVYDPRTHELRYAVAGHPPPVVRDPGGETAILPSGGPPIGEVFDAALLERRRATIRAGSYVTFFTDGLLEFARDPLDAEQRLLTAVKTGHFANASNPAQALIDDVLAGPQRDDIAVLVMRTS
jgi:PAS domain S-box-containing protein